MSLLDKVLSVSITRQTTAVSQAGFGILLITGDSDNFPKVDSVVLTMDAQLVTGNQIDWKYNGSPQTPITYATSSDATMAAFAAAIAAKTEVASATPSDVGAVGYDNTITVTGNADPARVIISDVTVTLGASQPTFTQVYTAHTRIRYYSSLTAVADDFASTEQEYIAASAAFAQSPPPNSVGIGQKRSGDADWTAAFNAIANEDATGWYAMAITSRTKADQVELATWAESNLKLAGVASSDSVILTTGTTDIAATLNASSRERTFTFYHPSADGSNGDEYPDCALFGKMLPTTPGSATWAFNRLSGVTVYSLTETERINAMAKECNVYLELAGTPVVFAGDVNGDQSGGVVASGEYIDTIRGTDWLKAEIQTNLASRLINLPKIPFTDAGGLIISAEIRKALDQGITNGFLAENVDEDKYDGKKYQLVIPKVADISFNDRAARKFTGITFTATLAGAVHYIQVTGAVEV